VDPDLTGFDTHGTKALEVVEALEDNGALKEEKHPKLHQTEVPVVVEKPQARCEQLEHEEGRHNVLLVDLQELRNGNVHLVGTPNEVGLLERGGILDTLSTLVILDSVVDRVGDLGKSLALLTVAELLFLHLHLMCHDYVSCRQLHRLHDDWHDEPLHDILLFVVYTDAYVGALIDLAVV